jgi:hypothetical protein
MTKRCRCIFLKKLTTSTSYKKNEKKNTCCQSPEIQTIKDKIGGKNQWKKKYQQTRVIKLEKNQDYGSNEGQDPTS